MTQSNDDLRFEDLGLSQPVLQALDLKGYNNPTPIQAQAIPPVLEGRDLMGIAQTGTGKTAAFMLPSIDRLREADKQTPFKSCRMLVLAPTRELAGQIAQNAKDYGALAGLKVHSIVGGTSVNKDRNKLHRGTDILVATPGRLLDLIDQKAFTLDKVEVLVLDEADQMLDLGFIHALRRISQLVPEDRQTLFFSATMPKQIQELVGKYCRNPVKVSVTPESTTAERIDQFLFMVQQDEKQTLLEMILSERHPVPGKFERVLIFARTKHGCDRIVKKLSQSGIPANAIHGNKSQPQRERALGEFRSAKTPILVATDVAARGIDIPGVSHVLNYELPNVPEQYVHRIGRTARAGRDGIAIAFCAEDERDYLKDIRKKTDAEFERLALPDNFRAVVEGVGPTKREQKPRLARPKVRPAGDAARKPKPKQKHTARKGKPAGAGSGGTGAGAGRPGGNRNRSRNRRRSGGGAPRG
ncbi:DEAD/DEAH box helicase [Erythrobacter sp. HI0037]|uniref:DEAD/DEAH box helicase n=1 Tax=Qipengyuania flava TaxID=192812 RepID=A0A3T1CK05_9SPHN|nr:DEAD/DEAH box helicase [Qipengyuania flava]KZX87296.1 DEAD/DEAH box helicase [Erythrobacter sp. HI0020]KZY11446.1 DEAD/DEAH box helicase [Erythrobacter sp. HI0037]KZY14167.1 DEAD/DEAH box helicase [Erythrobacter sp. HI0038]BBI21319.1 DEAD/DEAH box helicase [Qipengyuania flava]